MRLKELFCLFRPARTLYISPAHVVIRDPQRDAAKRVAFKFLGATSTASAGACFLKNYRHERKRIPKLLEYSDEVNDNDNDIRRCSFRR